MIKLMKKDYFLILLAIFFLFTPQSLFALSISPTKAEIVLAPGATKSIFLQVENNEKNLIKVNFKVWGVKQDSEGRPIFSAGSDEAETWIQVPPEISLKPQEKKSVEFKLTVPFNTYPTAHNLALVAEKSSVGEGIGLNTNLATLFTIQVSGTAVERLQINQWFTEKFFNFNKIWQFTLSLKNFSNVRTPALGEVKIFKASGEQVYQTNLNLSPEFFPNAERKIKTVVDLNSLNLSSGIYRAQAAVVYGYTRQLLLQNISVVYVSPLALSFIIVLLLAIIIAGGWRISKRRQKANNS